MTSPSKNKVFNPDWALLQILRERFLGGTFTDTSYWESDEVLSQYDATFGQRISWKWLSVLEASRTVLNWEGKFDVLDWGCGTGIASSSFLQTVGIEKVGSVFLYDKSKRAVSFSQKKLASLFPDVGISSWEQKNYSNNNSLPLVLLVSHVLNELSEQNKKELFLLMKKAKVIIWVEPGTPQNSEFLIQWREELRSDFLVALPCPHQEVCGLFQSRSKNWCHFFAETPTFVFQDPFWKLFSDRMGIDLRSLPVSFFLAVSKTTPSPRVLSPSADSSKRLLGRARHYKGYSLAVTCEKSGVQEEKILQRSNKEVINILKENGFLTKLLLH